MITPVNITSKYKAHTAYSTVVSTAKPLTVVLIIRLEESSQKFYPMKWVLSADAKQTYLTLHSKLSYPLKI